MIEVFTALGLGLVLGRKTRLAENRWIPLFSQAGLLVLLFSVGLQLGSPEVLSRLVIYGREAVATSLGATGLSVLLVALLESLLKKRRPFRQASSFPTGSTETDGTPLKLALSLAIGLLVGKCLPTPTPSLPTITTASLCWLVFLTGMDIARSSAWSKLRELGLVALLVPLLISTGSIMGALIMGKLCGLEAGRAMSVGAGFGWYSLCGVIVGRIGGPGAGAVAFMSNLLREALTFMIVPFTGRCPIRLLGVALGGATTMDSTLPLISRFTDPEVSIIAFVSGVVLTLLAPLLIPLLFSF
ncbi:MAG TPA: lysine exporter LysO family protein [Firmicutes bacterium]|nr:lysine exporter LysO family protein [Bacillota bacterium]